MPMPRPRLKIVRRLGVQLPGLTRKDAERFQKGFEGTVMDFAAAKAHLSGQHHDLHSHFGTG